MKTILPFEDINWLVEYWITPAQKETRDQEGFPEVLAIYDIKFPNGSDTDSYITDKMREDMLDALREKLDREADEKEVERQLDSLMNKSEWVGFIGSERLRNLRASRVYEDNRKVFVQTVNKGVNHG